MARDVGLIDASVGVRITPRADQTLLEHGTELTREGLGLPQYANDDVVIPALTSHGYDLEAMR
jgi:formate C-acetyltransferase